MLASNGKRVSGPAWTADIFGAHLSETGRLAFLENCVSFATTDPVLMTAHAHVREVKG